MEELKQAVDALKVCLEIEQKCNNKCEVIQDQHYISGKQEYVAETCIGLLWYDEFLLRKNQECFVNRYVYKI